LRADDLFTALHLSYLLQDDGSLIFGGKVVINNLLFNEQKVLNLIQAIFNNNDNEYRCRFLVVGILLQIVLDKVLLKNRSK